MTRLLPAKGVWRLAPLLAVLLVTASVWSAARVYANGVPQLVKLTYVAGLSNFGPQQASGVAEFSFSEGYLKLSASGLSRLQGAKYHVWLIKSRQNDALDVGAFEAQPDGSAHFEANLPAADYSEFDLVLLTVEDEPDRSPEPSERRAIGGYFSVVRDPNVTLTSGQTQPRGSGPDTLPNTGDADYLASTRRGGLLIGGLSMAMVLVGLSMVARRRRTQR